MAKKLFLLMIILLVSTSYLFSFDLALGAEAQYSPTLLTVGDSTSLLSDAGISLSISYETERLRYSSFFSFDKGWEHHSFHRFSRLNEISSMAFSSSIGYLIKENLSLNADIGLKLISVGIPPNNIRVLSPFIEVILRKEFLSKEITPSFALFIPLEYTFGKTAKGISLGIGVGYFFSLQKGEIR